MLIDFGLFWLTIVVHIFSPQLLLQARLLLRIVPIVVIFAVPIGPILSDRLPLTRLLFASVTFIIWLYILNFNLLGSLLTGQIRRLCVEFDLVLLVV